MVATIPAAALVPCPRCIRPRPFLNVSGGGVQYRCGGCEWTWTFGTQAPTGVTNAARAVGAATIPVASGGASFTASMYILMDTGVNAEVVVATATGSATSVPVTPYAKAHSSGAAFGQLLLTSTYAAVGEEAVPNAPGWGF